MKVLSMARRKNRETGWDLHVKNLGTNEEPIQSFDKVIVCTGACAIAINLLKTGGHWDRELMCRRHHGGK
jgi:hypothetical protein